jgi:hypothetical protein
VAFDQWTGGRSSSQLASVQLGDARDQVVKAYRGIATLAAGHRLARDVAALITGTSG